MLSIGMLRTWAQSASCASHMYVLLYKSEFKEGSGSVSGRDGNMLADLT